MRLRRADVTGLNSLALSLPLSLHTRTQKIYIQLHNAEKRRLSLQEMKTVFDDVTTSFAPVIAIMTAIVIFLSAIYYCAKRPRKFFLFKLSVTEKSKKFLTFKSISF